MSKKNRSIPGIIVGALIAASIAVIFFIIGFEKLNEANALSRLGTFYSTQMLDYLDSETMRFTAALTSEKRAETMGYATISFWVSGAGLTLTVACLVNYRRKRIGTERRRK